MSDSDVEEPVMKKGRHCTFNSLKRNISGDEEIDSKRHHLTTEVEMDTTESPKEKKMDSAAKRREHFLSVCEFVSYVNFSDHKHRFLTYPPSCTLEDCDHKQAPSLSIANFARETFYIDYKSQMWCEALHVCEMIIGRDSYLAPEIMLDILEILMNVHPDQFCGYTTTYILNRCLHTMYLMYKTHPPCNPKIREAYKRFLILPLTIKKDTFSDRAKYDCDKGIVKYVLNRLEYEISADAKDEPLLEKTAHITEEMKQSVNGLNWQKVYLDILESLDRTERIKRLMMVFKCVMDLLIADLSIWFSSHIRKHSYQIMRSNRPILSVILWSDQILFTGAVNNNCRQIMRLFVDMAVLDYPEEDMRIMTQALNAMTQIFYMCEIDSDKDYPHDGKYCSKLADEMYALIKDLTLPSKNKVLSRIDPAFLRYKVAMKCIYELEIEHSDDILVLLLEFLKNSEWLQYADKTSDLKPSDVIEPAKKPLRIYTGFSKSVKYTKSVPAPKYNKKQSSIDGDDSLNLEDVFKVIVIALDSYLDMYRIDLLQKHLSNPSGFIGCESREMSRYALSEAFYKKYREICKNITELKTVIRKLQGNYVMKYMTGCKSLSLLGL